MSGIALKVLQRRDNFSSFNSLESYNYCSIKISMLPYFNCFITRAWIIRFLDKIAKRGFSRQCSNIVAIPQY